MNFSPDGSGNHFDSPEAKRKENQNIATDSGRKPPGKAKLLLLKQKKVRLAPNLFLLIKTT